MHKQKLQMSEHENKAQRDFYLILTVIWLCHHKTITHLQIVTVALLKKSMKSGSNTVSVDVLTTSSNMIKNYWVKITKILLNPKGHQDKVLCEKMEF